METTATRKSFVHAPSAAMTGESSTVKILYSNFDTVGLLLTKALSENLVTVVAI
jgi:hypothetical protein